MDAAIDIRSIGPCDRQAVEQFFERLSFRSRYLRFFAPIPRLTKRTLAALMDVDGDRHTALAAWQEDRMVGEARYVAFADHSAEVAVSVSDEFQRQGIGKRMVADVIDEAGKHGFCHLTASSLPENNAARSLLKASGFVMKRSGEGSEEWERDACPSEP